MKMKPHDLKAKAQQTFQVVNHPEGYVWQARYWVEVSPRVFPTEEAARRHCVATKHATLTAGLTVDDSHYSPVGGEP